MVMHNRNQGDSARRWWDELPPGIRTRFASVRQQADEPRPANPVPPVPARELLFDLSRLAVLFATVTAGIMLFLLVALSFVAH